MISPSMERTGTRRLGFIAPKPLGDRSVTWMVSTSKPSSRKRMCGAREQLPGIYQNLSLAMIDQGYILFLID
ncbi:hypothetical protein I7I50_05590 [Histoplasma capsulatum G186AR]|uniref:Uncharacterized protein n=1 Tax=Ajellomyces capsulatus TaxID=5037 RepID=A0A8H8D7V4_AJECA|nr:hypothetical protein I7I52_03850 [Histoplasma capsulatum]QSS76216.1 hypothetical protein I7I50_05590 [Histoplasma capsulatum G186AR]